MNRQAQAFLVSLGIHGAVLAALLLAGTIVPRTRTIVLDFSLGSAPARGPRQAPPAARPAPLKRVPGSVTPVARDDQSVPVKKHERDKVPAPVGQQPVVAPTEAVAGAEAAPTDGAAASAQYVAVQYVRIRDRIFRNLGYPTIARLRGWTGKVAVSFTVCGDGSVEDLAVVESSGHDVLDRAAMDAVRRSCPLPIPPVRTALVMPVIYRLE